MMSEKRSLRRRGEDAAAAYLERIGVCVVERSWRCEAGVIDVIAWEGDTLVLVDVKTRRSSTKPGVVEMTHAMRRRVDRLALAYRGHADIESKPWRYDRVDLLVIADDRALLRHQRDLLSSED